MLQLFLLAFNSLQVWSITAGLGAVPSEKVLHNLEPFFKSFFADELLYDIALSLIKLSILLLYRRVFPTRQMNITVWVLGATVIGWFLGRSCSPQCVKMENVLTLSRNRSRDHISVSSD